MSTPSSTLTTRGRAFVAAGIACAVCALLLGQKDLLRVAILLASLPMVTLLLAARARYRVSAYRTITPSRVSVGQPATVSLQVENVGRIPSAMLLLEEQLPYALGTRPRFVLDRLGARWQRTINYPVRSDTRGRFSIGPATLRVTDPFGLVELTRSFETSDALLVTPQTHAIGQMRLGGEGVPSGDNRPRAIASDGQEDVTVREYRQGDDLRRVHWRSSARRGELMVRREEQPWQNRATIFLDTRRTAHRGQGPASSFEWSVTAAASVAMHLLQRGYLVRLVTGTGTAVGADGSESSVRADAEDLILHTLTLVELTDAPPADAFDSSVSSGLEPGGLLFAIVGFGDPAEIPVLDRLRHSSSGAYLIGLDPAAPGYERWRHVVASQGDQIPAVWARLLSGAPLDAGAAVG